MLSTVAYLILWVRVFDRGTCNRGLVEFKTGEHSSLPSCNMGTSIGQIFDLGSGHY